MAQKGDIEDWMNFHEFGKFKLNNERISFKHMFNSERTDMTVI